jgi:hypothetical protein
MFDALDRTMPNFLKIFLEIPTLWALYSLINFQDKTGDLIFFDFLKNFALFAALNPIWLSSTRNPSQNFRLN